RLRAERRVFTPGGLPCAPGCRERQKMAESRATCSDRMEEVSRLCIPYDLLFLSIIFWLYFHQY
ncbi:MAG: hypothetical protein U9N77_02700, partial [Thermodesulfobacteriota bacterium]|nr:hypothetical protein [Thermodesulfobacteriota bacterium]